MSYCSLDEAFVHQGNKPNIPTPISRTGCNEQNTKPNELPNRLQNIYNKNTTKNIPESESIVDETRNIILYLKRMFPDPTEFLGVLMSDWPILRDKVLQWKEGNCDILGLRPNWGKIERFGDYNNYVNTKKNFNMSQVLNFILFFLIAIFIIIILDICFQRCKR